MNLYKSSPVRPGGFALWRVDGPLACRLRPACSLRKTYIFAATVGKTDGSGLPTSLLAPKDGPPGAQDGLPTGLLAHKTASRRAS